MLGKFEKSTHAFDLVYFLDVKNVSTGIVNGLSLLTTVKFDGAIRYFSEVYGVLLMRPLILFFNIFT